MSGRRGFLAGLLGTSAAVVATPAAAVVPAIVREAPDVAPILNKMIRELSAAGGGKITMAPRPYRSLSSIVMRSHVTLAAPGAVLNMEASAAPAIRVPHGAKNVGLSNISIVGSSNISIVGSMSLGLTSQSLVRVGPVDVDAPLWRRSLGKVT